MGDATVYLGAVELGVVFRRDKARKDIHATRLDDEIVPAAPEARAAILHDAHAAAIRTVVRNQFLQPDHTVDDAVHGLVQRVGCQVVQHQHGGAVLGEEMLQSEDLAPVAQ